MSSTSFRCFFTRCTYTYMYVYIYIHIYIYLFSAIRSMDVLHPYIVRYSNLCNWSKLGSRISWLHNLKVCRSMPLSLDMIKVYPLEADNSSNLIWFIWFQCVFMHQRLIKFFSWAADSLLWDAGGSFLISFWISCTSGWASSNSPNLSAREEMHLSSHCKTSLEILSVVFARLFYLEANREIHSSIKMELRWY